MKGLTPRQSADLVLGLGFIFLMRSWIGCVGAVLTCHRLDLRGRRRRSANASSVRLDL